MSHLDREEKYRTLLLGPGVTAVWMLDGCSIIWVQLCFLIICLLGKASRGSIIKDISVKTTEGDYNSAVNGKRKGKRERGRTTTVVSEVCLWLLFGERNTLWIKCPRQILVPSQWLPAHPSRSSQGSQTGCWAFAARQVPSSPASKAASQHHVVMEEAKTRCCLAISADVTVPGKTIQFRKTLKAF